MTNCVLKPLEGPDPVGNLVESSRRVFGIVVGDDLSPLKSLPSGGELKPKILLKSFTGFLDTVFGENDLLFLKTECDLL